MNITDDVRDVLARSLITTGETGLTLLRLPEQLDRKAYVAVMKVLKLAGGKWQRGIAAHVFETDPRTVLGIAVEQGTIVDKKTELQQFYTPVDLATQVAEEACAMPGETVLEPSSGGGALVRALLVDGTIEDEITTIDIDPDAARIPGVEHVTADFLKLDAIAYDVVVMNPPFTKGQAIAHVAHALTLVQRRLVAIMPNGFLDSTRKAPTALLAQLEAGFVYTVIDLPPGAFKEAGTLVRTQMLIADKDTAAL
jgi:hypothetical protein